ncbi:MFS transporter [Chelativorans salis]|uniref:MFS transporter n=1 Tax=Chelativorans salis TaxID=2978478 RepID=A0ABT2LTW9_9HYPH|nr:MFS transporter [Chelativorans sp. EGI FJ00035]MCT7376818.1 MFS transporter [Chelativorans sp. EGI FJ00035]
MAGTAEEKGGVNQLNILMLAVAVVASNSLVLSPILPDVARSLSSTHIAISRAVAVYGAGTMLSALFLAPQIDRFGARQALRFGLLALAVALLCSAGATNSLMLMGAQALAGLSAGIILPATYTLATVCAGPNDLSRSLGKVLFGWSLAFACGIPGLALISDLLAWRLAYLILFAVVLIIAVEIHRVPSLGDRVANDTVRFSTFSALSYRDVLRLLAVCLCFTTAFYGVFAFLADQARQALIISASAAGAIILAFGVGFAAGTPATQLVDKIGASRLLPVVLLMNAAVYGLMGVAGNDYTATLAVVILWGAMTNVSLNMIVLLLSQISSTDKGRILGLNSATTYLGATFGVTVAGSFYESFGFQTVLLWAVLLQICGAMLLWAVRLSRQ